LKLEAFFFLGITTFFAVVGAIYWFTSYEDAGTVMLVAAALLGIVAGGYLLFQSRRFPPRPQDRSDATVADAVGAVERFPSPTIWPFVFGFGVTMLFTGFAFGLYVALGGGILAGLGTVGLVRQSRGPRRPQVEVAEGQGDGAGSSTST
jgi:Cytochrome c oxidase subunit IV